MKSHVHQGTSRSKIESWVASTCDMEKNSAIGATAELFFYLDNKVTIELFCLPVVFSTSEKSSKGTVFCTLCSEVTHMVKQLIFPLCCESWDIVMQENRR